MEDKKTQAIGTDGNGANGLLTLREVAETLRVRPGTVYAMVARRQIGYVKVGSLLRFSPAHVQNYIGRHAVAPVRAQ